MPEMRRSAACQRRCERLGGVTQQPLQLGFKHHIGGRSARDGRASNIFLGRCSVLGSRDSTMNSCIPFGSYFTCSQRWRRSIARPTALYSVRPSTSTACSTSSASFERDPTVLHSGRITYSLFVRFAGRPRAPPPGASCPRASLHTGSAGGGLRRLFNELEPPHQFRL